MEVLVEEDILRRNNKAALELNNYFADRGIFVVNLISSPGSGKTTLLECTIAALGKKINMAVIEGDLFTDKDAQRILKSQIPCVQINTKGGCHLTAEMVGQAISCLNFENIDVVFIENVGNLVCPAEFDIGEDAKVVILSIAEGADKPLKYPLVFCRSTAVVINKIDLVPFTDVSIDRLIQDIANINPRTQVIRASCRTGEGLTDWYEWLIGEIGKKKMRSGRNV